MRVLVLGAGVVGQVYGGRLLQAGHDVTVMARGATHDRLAARGLVISTDSGRFRARPAVVDAPPSGARYDVVLVTVRRDQLDAALPAVAGLAAERVVLMLNQPRELERVLDRAGGARAVVAFPGIGGYLDADGTVRYIEISQQPTTLGRADGAERLVVDLMRSGGFRVEVVPNIEAWLQTHAVFVTAVCAAILARGGDSTALAADARSMRELVSAVREGFNALARKGIAVTPRPLRIIFTRVPRFAAVRYWRANLRGAIGTVAFAPHARATHDTELPVLCADVRLLVAGGGPVPQLERLLKVAS